MGLELNNDHNLLNNYYFKNKSNYLKCLQNPINFIRTRNPSQITINTIFFLQISVNNKIHPIIVIKTHKKNYKSN